MAAVQAITKTTTMAYCSDFAQTFIHSISKIMSGYKDDRVIFDRYIKTHLNLRHALKDPVGLNL